ncbi:minor tail protein [Arthrobacter phage Kuleana]|uniref:Minor tail protein n=1 Tax=Arthrobacter phage Kuleana TaxID=2653270 RepID=A0A5Q2WEJ5_9CAUD|nr:minor tail protein [Arthrobacter phage Kuleana]QGH74506.1 minor tail protein [Arthrobacter phage Kuleana]
MADLANVAAAIPGGGAKKYRGIVVTSGGRRLVNVDGVNLDATWADPLVVDDGDSVDVEIRGGAEGLKVTHVLSRTTLQPRPRTGTVTAVPAGSSTITVSAGGVSYSAEFIGTYAVGNVVHLDWGAGRPRVIGKFSSTAPAAPPPAPPPPPPPAPTTGSLSGTAIKSGTIWGPGGWDSWAGGRENVFQGDYGYGPVHGAWFYGTRFKTLAGRTITRIRFRTGARLPAGASGSPVAFNFYTHTSSSRPAGDVTRTGSVFSKTINPGQGPTWIDLPLSFAPALLAGGGIAISGGAYAGMKGRVEQVDSGALILDWKSS